MYKSTLITKLSRGLEGDALELFQQAAALTEEVDGKSIAQVLTELKDSGVEGFEAVISEAKEKDPETSDLEDNDDSFSKKKKKDDEDDSDEDEKDSDGDDVEPDGDEDDEEEKPKDRFAKMKFQKEDTEQLDELKASTLGSYIKKASDDRTGSAYLEGRHSTRPVELPSYKKTETYSKAEKKRGIGINKAADKLVKGDYQKEDVNIDGSANPTSYGPKPKGSPKETMTAELAHEYGFQDALNGKSCVAPTNYNAELAHAYTQGHKEASDINGKLNPSNYGPKPSGSPKETADPELKRAYRNESYQGLDESLLSSIYPNEWAEHKAASSIINTEDKYHKVAHHIDNANLDRPLKDAIHNSLGAGYNKKRFVDALNSGYQYAGTEHRPALLASTDLLNKLSREGKKLSESYQGLDEAKEINLTNKINKIDNKFHVPEYDPETGQEAAVPGDEVRFKHENKSYKGVVSKRQSIKSPMPHWEIDLRNESYTETILNRIDEINKIESMEPEGLSIQEDVDAMFEGSDISEEFKEKASYIFEAAVARQVSAYKELVNEAIEDLVEEEIQTISEELTDKIDQYLDYVVEEWVDEHQIEVESGIRTEVTENFILGLKDLFLEHYIEVPEGREDVLETIASEKQEIEEEFETAVQKNLALIAEIKELKKGIIVEELSKGLADTEAEKLESLAEGVIFESVDDYTKKVSLIRESYFEKQPKSRTKTNPVILDEEALYFDEEVITDSKMAKYANTLSKFK